ncbi:MAG: DUF488 domain-containing protein [Rhodanobacter sp.]|nr:MAG: DUF488 domain-containing protein [Rhodanobacter sp.]TAM07771.1 MAG: DUF488 domain-containing protein [Rhodanobacter sp.]TAM35918.1 MAG: DUF488 domain-containing protein [Rhodanobacter sp.]
MNATDPQTVWTIGHSTRTLDEFLALLAVHRIEAIADVRHFPGSRHVPQFACENFEPSLVAHGFGYAWFEDVGGRRPVHRDSPNTAWRNASFRGYADYMATPQFVAGFAALLAYARRQRTAIMCAEAVWWRCHRSMLADAMKVRGIEVIHILDAKHTKLHPYTSAAHVENGVLSYAGPQATLR